MTSANKIKLKTKKTIKIYETIKPTKLTSTNAKLYERRTLTLAKDKRMDIQMDERPSDDGNDCSCAQRHAVINIKHR